MDQVNYLSRDRKKKHEKIFSKYSPKKLMKLDSDQKNCLEKEQKKKRIGVLRNRHTGLCR